MLLYQEHFCSAMWSMQTGEISLLFFPFSGFLPVWHCKQALDLFSVGWKREPEKVLIEMTGLYFSLASDVSLDI
jgi:hypothetical protein